MAEKRTGNSEMSDVAEAAKLMRQVLPRDDRTIQEWIRDTAIRLRIPYSTAKNVWYEEKRIIPASLMDTLRAAVRPKAEQLKGARDDYRKLRDRLARMEAYLAHVDPDFHGESIDAVREQDGRYRSLDRTGD